VIRSSFHSYSTNSNSISHIINNECEYTDIIGLSSPSPVSHQQSQSITHLHSTAPISSSSSPNNSIGSGDISPPSSQLQQISSSPYDDDDDDSKMMINNDDAADDIDDHGNLHIHHHHEPSSSSSPSRVATTDHRTLSYAQIMRDPLGRQHFKLYLDGLMMQQHQCDDDDDGGICGMQLFFKVIICAII